MPARVPPSDSILARAAAVRAEGGNWEAAAKKVGRSPHSVRKWPLMYPERWSRVMRDATRRVIDDAGAEGTVLLRQFLRDAKDNVRMRSAWYLLYQRLELLRLELRAEAHLPPPPPPELQRLVNLMASQIPERFTPFAPNAERGRQAGEERRQTAAADSAGSA